MSGKCVTDLAAYSNLQLLHWLMAESRRRLRTVVGREMQRGRITALTEEILRRMQKERHLS